MIIMGYLYHLIVRMMLDIMYSIIIIGLWDFLDVQLWLGDGQGFENIRHNRTQIFALCRFCRIPGMKICAYSLGL